MANTQNFEVVAELRESSLKELLKAAWKSGGDASQEGVIPEKIDIPGPSVPGPVQFGPYQVSSGQIQIPQEQLDLSMDPAINGLKIKLGTLVHIEIANPPIDSAKLFDITADAFIRTPIGSRNNNEIVADFTALPANAVTIVITSGDPIGPITTAAVDEFVHKKYQENALPHVIDPIPLSLPPFSMKCRIEFYDDATNATKKITVVKPDATHIKISIPCYLRFYDIAGSALNFSLATPMAVNAVAIMTADYIETPTNITVKISTATVELTNITAAAGTEGANYISNKTIISYVGNLDTLIKTGFNTGAVAQLKAMGDISVNIPTLTQIQDFAAGVVKKELERRKQIQIWKVETVDGTQTTINNVTPKALSDCMAICINDMGGGNPGALINFIPASRDFAIATSEKKIQAAFIKERNDRYPELKDGNSHTIDHKVEGKTVKLNSLGLVLHDGYIEINGDVTIVDAVADSIDVDAGFEQKVSLSWNPDGSSPQELKHKLEGDPDVSLGAAAWILSALIGFLTFGIIGLIIGLIIIAIVESVASQIGGIVAKDQSGNLSSLGAWPGNVDKIGNIKANFNNPVIIETTGLVFAGQMLITSSQALTSLDMARSNGPYATSGNIPVNFNGGANKQTSVPKWILGDGNQQNLRSLSHRYGKSGLYVAHVQIQVNETGGVTTKHYTRVQVQNVAPVVKFDGEPVITINEGQEIELSASFTDDNWLDTHIAWFDFADNTAPANAVLTVTNNEPQATGTAKAKHAWCDNGVYIVKVFVQDDAGGIGEASMTVQVNNVPPKIIAPKKICVLRNQPVRLEAIFTDPGWCDTHVATWDTGDGHIKMGTIKERVINYMEIGYASASHIYNCIGHYVARVTVTDDDGGEDSACVYVNVTELQNASFENGFRYRLGNAKYNREDTLKAKVANEWYPFVQQVTPVDNASSSTGINQQNMIFDFDADEFIYRNGQRSQVVKLQGTGLVGIRQTLCANKEWDYEFTTHYHLPVQGVDSKLMIGIDPMGEKDPASLNIEWVQALPIDEWVHASVRVTAKATAITCYVGLLQHNSSAELFIDKTELYMIQPVYSRPEKNRDEDKDCCPVDEIEQHDFNKLDSYIGKRATADYQSAARYTSTAEGVRFVNADNKPKTLMMIPSAGNASMAGTIIKGVAQVSSSVMQSLVKGTLETLMPFLKKK